MSGGGRKSGWRLERLVAVRAAEVQPDYPATRGALDSLLTRQAEVSGLRRADIVLRRAREVGRTPIEGAYAAPTPSAQREVFLQMEKAGADLLSATSGFDVQGLAEATSGVNRPCGVCLDQADPRAAAEAALALGATYLSLPGNRVLGDTTNRRSAEYADYVDRLIGFFEDNGRRIVREIAPAPVSPAAAIAIALCETQLALDQGVRTLVASVGLRGALIEDVASLNVLRALAGSWLTRRDVDFEFYAGAAGWTAPAPREIDRGYALALNTALAAALGRADVYSARPTRSTAHGDLKAVLDGVQCARQMFDLSAGQWLEASDDLSRAEGALKAEVLAVLGDLSSAALRVDDRAFADRLRLAGSRAVAVNELFTALPRHSAQGLVTSSLGPWSDDPLSEPPR